MGTVPATRSFNLLENPFVLLNISTSASNLEIIEAFEDAVAEDRAPEPVLNEAKQNLLDPKFRIHAELSTLLDTPVEKSLSAIAILRSRDHAPDTKTLLSTLGSLSRLNFLCHIALNVTREVDLLSSLIDLRAQIRYDNLLQILNTTREAAGLRGPTLDAVRKSFDALFDQQMEAVFASYGDVASAAKDVQSSVERVLAQAKGEQIDALGLLMTGYRRRIEGELSSFRGVIQSAADELRRSASNTNSLRDLLSALDGWRQLDEPVQCLEQYKGRDDAEASRVFDELRELALHLANEQQRFEIALTISKASAKAFLGLPRAKLKVDEDIKALEERLAAQGAEGLSRFVGGFSDDMHRLSVSLQAYGLKPDASGPAGELFSIFAEAVANTRGTIAADLPWLILRNLAIKLNNEGNSPQAALAVIEGLIGFPGTERPSTDFLRTINADYTVAKRNALEKELVQKLETKDNSEALALVRQLLPLTEGQEQKKLLQDLQSKLKAKRATFIGRIVVFSLIGAVILTGAISQNSGTTSHYTPSYTPPPSAYTPRSTDAPSVPPTFDTGETIPPVGSDIAFLQSNVRYCLFQKDRLEYARTGISDETQYGFNAAVNDWNSRCSSYRYRPSDQAAVQGELFEQAQALRSDANDLLRSWGRRETPPASPSPLAMPSQAPMPAPTNTPVWPTPTPSNTASPTPVANSRPMDISPLANKPRADLLLNPLLLKDAARVQKRLIELGYLTGQANGTWGPLTRAALRTFKAANGLTDDDGLDTPTASTLFSADATRASGTALAKRSEGHEFTYAPPSGASLNPLNAADAVRIHARLRELGLYKGKNDMLWSPASREAIKKFEAKNGLPANVDWDANVERLLFGNASR